VVYTVSAKNLTLVKTAARGHRCAPAADCRRAGAALEGSGEISAEVKTGKLTVKIAAPGTWTFPLCGQPVHRHPRFRERESSRPVRPSADANMAGSGDVELGTYETLDAKIAGSGTWCTAGAPA
jgi:hypothetical protein